MPWGIAFPPARHDLGRHLIQGEPLNFKAHFRRALAADPNRLHLAAHSHHLWPDVSFDAQVQYWEDSARRADLKWHKIFAEIYPDAQCRVAARLGLSNPNAIAFGPNTHSFLLRLLSCLPLGAPVRVLTSDSEFHSFSRQMARLEEDGLVHLHTIPSEPFASFTDRFGQAAEAHSFDLIYFSQVFYNSGYAIDHYELFARSLAQVQASAMIVVDGYHGFMALPCDHGAVEHRAFYLAGGYKYAMAGEGAAFLYAPADFGPRPRDTGWYASFGGLERGNHGTVGYAADGSRFLGATFDPSGIYRLRAVLAWLDDLGLSTEAIHQHVVALQTAFVEQLAAMPTCPLRSDQLVVPIEEHCRGNFLTFRCRQAEALYKSLLSKGVITDYRGDRLRFGFGLYHDRDDVDLLVQHLQAL